MKNHIIEEDLRNICNAPLPWNKFEGKIMLISGANGFVPAYMVHTLLYLNDTVLKDKVRVIAVARNKKRALERFPDYMKRKDFKPVIQDICDPASIKGPVNFIIHAASQASPKFFGSDPVGTLSANVIGTMNLLELAKAKKSEGFLYLSGGEVYGKVDEKQFPIKEDNYGYLDPLDVRSCYAESKRMGENMCVSFKHQFGVNAKIARLSHTYGPGLHLDDGRVFSDFISDILNNRDIVLKSDGSAIRSFCYLADATVALFAILLKGNAGEAYNVGNDRGETSILDLAKLLVSSFPEKKLKISIQKDAQNQKGYLKSRFAHYHPDITKVKALGYRPKFSIKEGFIRTVRSFE